MRRIVSVLPEAELAKSFLTGTRSRAATDRLRRRLREGQRRRPALGWLGMESSRNHVRQLARDDWAEPVHGDGRASQALDPKLRNRRPRVGEPACEHLVKHDAQ